MRPSGFLFSMAPLLAVLMTVSACSRNLDSATYTSGNTVGKVVYGTVVSARPVTVKDHDKLEENALGGIAGGVAGGVAGSAVGKGTGNGLATVGGAIAGALIGAYAQDQLSTTDGIEYVVKLDATPRPAAAAQKKITLSGQDSIKQSVQDAAHVAPTESDVIAVVQQDATMLPVGQRVMVIYSDDRPRVVPAQ